ncbi:MAG: DUF1207 domain-containing protein [Ignavibacteriales bacterium]|nr:DUF1207 domain-containing protein [Ignavibacteriales bacterium]
MKKLFLLILLLSSITVAQIEVEYFPDGLTIHPFAANTLEPKLGFLFKINSNELQLNIGNSMDLVRIQKGKQTFSVGADLFTWTLLRKENNFHFPVDAVDYLFGLNFGYKRVMHNFSFGARVRLSHISAHLVDGHYNGILNQWNNDHYPRVYSREFIEGLAYVKYKRLRVYGGITYLYHVDPVEIKKDNYQLGFDYYFNKYFGGGITPFIGYDLKLVHLSKYTGNNSFTAGVKFGKIEGKGLSLAFNYYSGYSIHGEYFDSVDKYSSLSINLDL